MAVWMAASNRQVSPRTKRSPEVVGISLLALRPGYASFPFRHTRNGSVGKNKPLARENVAVYARSDEAEFALFPSIGAKGNSPYARQSAQVELSPGDDGPQAFHRSTIALWARPLSTSPRADPLTEYAR
jgi:hypothetical protein